MTKLVFVLALISPIVVSGVMVVTLPSQPLVFPLASSARISHLEGAAAGRPPSPMPRPPARWPRHGRAPLPWRADKIPGGYLRA